MSPLGVLLWIAEHWWIAAAVLLVAVAALTFRGVLSIAQILAAVLKAIAAVANFYVTPREQLAGKSILTVAMLAIGISIGYAHGLYVDSERWKAAQAAAVAAAEKLRQSIEQQIRNENAAAMAAEKQRADEAEKRAEEYEKQLAQNPAVDCRFNDDDLRHFGRVR